MTQPREKRSLIILLRLILGRVVNRLSVECLAYQSRAKHTASS